MIDEIDRILAKLTAIEREIVEKRLLSASERRRQRLDRRNSELRSAAALLSGSISVRAARLSLLAGRYEASAWRRDRQLSEAPAAYSGTITEHLWAAFRAAGGSVPRSPSTLRQILSSDCSDSEKAAEKNRDKSAELSVNMLGMIFEKRSNADV